MKPNCPGVWEWIDENGLKRLVEVVDCSAAKNNSHLRVYWWGGYYNINDEIDDIYNIKGEKILENYVIKAEWPDRWGNRIGDNHSIPEDQIYLIPTQEELDRIKEAEKTIFKS